MDAIKSWTALIAATAIIGAVFTALLPPGKTKAAFITLAGVVIVCAVISPFASKDELDFNLLEDIQSFKEEDEKYMKQSEDASKKIAQSGYEAAVRKRLTEMKYSVESVDVTCDGNCKVERLKIVISGKINESEIKTAAEIICGGVSEIEIVKKGEPNEKRP